MVTLGSQFRRSAMSWAGRAGCRVTLRSTRSISGPASRASYLRRAVLGISRGMLYKLRRQGLITFKKIGGASVVTRAQLEALLASLPDDDAA
jgi:hypothetical protein